VSRSTRLYFEKHAHDYSKDPKYYSLIAEEIRKTISTIECPAILDVGCGNGNFIKTLFDSGIEAHYFGTDLSIEMIKIADNKSAIYPVDFIIADGLSMPIKRGTKFDIIHIDSVLHHLIDNTRAKSIHLVKKMIEALVTLLDTNGILIVQEVFYDSYLVHSLTSFMIFYGLKVMNSLGLDFSHIDKEMKPGLEVNFFHERQLSKLLGEYGHTDILNKTIVQIPRAYKVALLKNRGQITFIARRPL
jgi:SAM-dependent methyltransferase